GAPAAVLRSPERDPAVDAPVLISGGYALLGPHRPPNTLLVYASRDPGLLREAVPELAGKLAGVESARDGERYGDFAARTAVRMREIPGTDHGTILWSETTAREVLDWLDASFGCERRGERAL